MILEKETQKLYNESSLVGTNVFVTWQKSAESSEEQIAYRLRVNTWNKLNDIQFAIFLPYVSDKLKYQG